MPSTRLACWRVQQALVQHELLLTEAAMAPVRVTVNMEAMRPAAAEAVMPVTFRYWAGGWTPAEFWAAM